MLTNSTHKACLYSQMGRVANFAQTAFFELRPEGVQGCWAKELVELGTSFISVARAYGPILTGAAAS